MRRRKVSRRLLPDTGWTLRAAPQCPAAFASAPWHGAPRPPGPGATGRRWRGPGWAGAPGRSWRAGDDGSRGPVTLTATSLGDGAAWSAARCRAGRHPPRWWVGYRG